MFNEPMLMMSPFKTIPLACFSLRTPWLYEDEDYCGSPEVEGHTNGSGVAGPCGGCFHLNFFDESENLIAELKNEERYQADPYEMYQGRWGDFYESARTFTEPLAIAEGANGKIPIRSIKFNLLFGDFDWMSIPTRENYDEAYKVGKFAVSLETPSGFLYLVRNGACYCYYREDATYHGLLTMRDMYGDPLDLTISIPETLSLCYQDIQKIHINVTAGMVAWHGPSSGEIV